MGETREEKIKMRDYDDEKKGERGRKKQKSKRQRRRETSVDMCEPSQTMMTILLTEKN